MGRFINGTWVNDIISKKEVEDISDRFNQIETRVEKVEKKQEPIEGEK